MEKTKVKVYNSSERLVFEVSYAEFVELKKNHQINGSDRIVFSK